jgi:hypothetical protein
MKAFLIISVLALFSGCINFTHPTETAPFEYTWTPDQWEEIKKESEWCSENTEFSNSYCFGSAIMRHGTKIKSEDAK